MSEPCDLVPAADTPRQWCPEHGEWHYPTDDDLRSAFVRRLTEDSPHHDRRRRDFNQAVFLETGEAVWTSTTLDMVLTAFDAAVADTTQKDARRR
jgi:hypothetical protein